VSEDVVALEVPLVALEVVGPAGPVVDAPVEPPAPALVVGVVVSSTTQPFSRANATGTAPTAIRNTLFTRGGAGTLGTRPPLPVGATENEYFFAFIWTLSGKPNAWKVSYLAKAATTWSTGAQ
jgi:hypothetical protein